MTDMGVTEVTNSGLNLIKSWGEMGSLCNKIFTRLDIN